MSLEHIVVLDVEDTVKQLAELRRQVSRLDEHTTDTIGIGVLPLLRTIDCAISWIVNLDYECRNLRHYNEISEMELQEYDKLFPHDIDAYSDKQLAMIKHFIGMIKIAEEQDKKDEG